MRALLAAVLVGVVHVHHAPSHDSKAPFEEVLKGAERAGLDFLVLTEHAPDAATQGPLPAAEREGLHRLSDGRELLVLVGVELGTEDGHLLALDLPELVPATGRRGRDVIADVHALGGFALVPHPFTHGGWHDWEAPFDGLEVQNHASAFRDLRGPLMLFWLVRAAFDREGVWDRMLRRPAAELERLDELLLSGRRVLPFAGADAHQNLSLLGWQLDPYEQLFSAVQMHCPQAPREPAAIWALLRSGRCWIRYSHFEERASEATERVFPSGRVELQLEQGERVLELRGPIIAWE